MAEFDIVCRNREEFIEDYLMVVTEHDRRWCEEMAAVFEALSEDDFYPTVFSPDEDLVFD